MRSNFSILTIFFFAFLLLAGCGNADRKSGSVGKKTDAELEKSDVTGEWLASGNGIKTKYVFRGGGSYVYFTEILGDLSSSQGRWSIDGSSVVTESDEGVTNNLEFSADHESFRANGMTYSR